MNNPTVYNHSLRRSLTALIATTALALLFAMSARAQTAAQWENLKGDISVFMANDLGRNGYYEQRPIARLMGEMAEVIGPECVVAAGDIHHFNGVASTSDPLWMTNFESIYDHPELMIDWFPVLGNHEYRGNTQAFVDYATTSRRWMPDGRYYSRVFTDDEKKVSLRLVLIDTTPLITRYRAESEVYPDASRQDVDAQLSWIDSTLTAAKEDWIIVIGHHPIYAQTTKAEYERSDMQQRLLPILRRHPNVSIYACGHIHNFQHIHMPGDGLEYVVNSSASLARKVKPTTGTLFCSSAPGFSVISATNASLSLYMIDSTGTVIHEVVKRH